MCLQSQCWWQRIVALESLLASQSIKNKELRVSERLSLKAIRQKAIGEDTLVLCTQADRQTDRQTEDDQMMHQGTHCGWSPQAGSYYQ